MQILQNLKLRWSNNGITWNDWINPHTNPITIASNEYVYFRAYGDKQNIFSIGIINCVVFDITGGSVHIGGNIQSLADATHISNTAGAFKSLFANCTAITDASDLKLIATDLQPYCYSNMFIRCKNMINPPMNLPATQLQLDCYEEMFANCASLQTAPLMTVEIAAIDCCANMFYGCNLSNLQASNIKLTAETGEVRCYTSMFENTNIRYVPTIKMKYAAKDCCARMFGNCKSLIQAAPKTLPLETTAPGCCARMFADCTNLASQLIDINAETLETQSCLSMYENCVNLTECVISSKYFKPNSCEKMFSGVPVINVILPNITKTDFDEGNQQEFFGQTASENQTITFKSV